MGNASQRVLVLGIGNSLLQDDGAGVHVAESFKSRAKNFSCVDVVDGGTLGLSLLSELEDAQAIIVVDAAELGEAAGEIRVFEGKEMDRQLSGVSSTVHELALSDLLAAAALTGQRPEHRALVAIQPASTEWGLEPTQAVQAAIPRATGLVEALVTEWAE